MWAPDVGAWGLGFKALGLVANNIGTVIIGAHTGLGQGHAINLLLFCTFFWVLDAKAFALDPKS